LSIENEKVMEANRKSAKILVILDVIFAIPLFPLLRRKARRPSLLPKGIKKILELQGLTKFL